MPEYLNARPFSYSLIIIAVISFSAVLLAVARYVNNRAIPTVAQVFIRFGSVENILKENMRINSFSSILLYCSHVVSFTVCLYLALTRIYLLNWENALLYAAIVTLVFIAFEFLFIVVMGWITGEQQRLWPAIVFTINVSQFVGLFLSLLAILWAADQRNNQMFFNILLVLVCVKYALRVLKSSAAVLGQGVKWYYLILYFCTLEILPLFVAYYYVAKNLQY